MRVADDKGLRRVFEKIRKLKALGTSSNVNEAAVAIAMAAELMQRHQIDEARLEAAPGTEGDDGAEPVEIGNPLHGAQRIQKWHALVGAGVAQALGCRLYQRKRVKGRPLPEFVGLMLIGRKSDASAARYLFQLIVSEVVRLCGEAMRTPYMPPKTVFQFFRSGGQGKRDAKWAASFKLGAAHTIRRRLFERHEQVAEEVEARAKAESTAGDTSTSRALAVIDDRQNQIAKLTEGWNGVDVKATVSDVSAFVAGRAAGEKVDLERSGRGALPAPRKEIEGKS